MKNKEISLKLSAVALAILLVGCGGGGSKGYYKEGSNSNVEGGSNGGGELADVQSLKITNFSLQDSNGSETQTISALGAIAVLKVTDGSGTPVSGAIVTFSGENMTFSTTNSSVFTNADGEASIGILPTNSNVTGAYVISATATSEDLSATLAKNVSFVKADVVIDKLVAAPADLVSGGSTLLTLVTKDATGNYQNNQEVKFSASCGSFSNSSVVSLSEGNVSNTYYAYDDAGKLCSGSQDITVTPNTSPANAKVISVNIEAAIATSIVYTSQAIRIPILGSGSSSSGQVEFTVYSNGTALPNQDVTLSLNKAPSGSSFVSLGNTADRVVKTDSNGKVIVNLYPGDIPGPVEIKATLPNGFSALSKNITITTGRATQNSFSLSVSKNSLENDKDGDVATIVARLADRNGNDVPNGTVVNFVTEGGKVGGACSTTNGQCSVELSTQNPRPADGRVSVLAYVEGDKSYIDTNGDNIYTPGEDTLVNNIGSFFRDDNENNSYDSTIGEFKYTRQLTGLSLACGTSSISEPNLADEKCDDQLSAILRQQIILYFADSTGTIRDLRASNSSLSFSLFGNSALTTPMPSGTRIEVTPEDSTDNGKSCNAELATGSNPIANVINTTYYEYRLKDCTVGDNFKITTTAPNGKISNFYVTYR
ncbi:Ig-like domain-containing protein [Acinetobacter indicus]|uniref:hypothetical protein n=1 Tax=Acinetobacter indicus TaxID=756892 RepID=UPI003988BDD8